MKCTTCGTALDSRATFCPNCGATVPDPFIGQVVGGRYELARRIAIGTFGSIYRGTDIVSGKTVALKIMHRELGADAGLLERFRREGVVLRKLLSTNVVATYELGEADGLPYIAMELLEGSTLLDLFRASGALPWQRAFSIGVQVCAALSEAHGLGIIHRDLKPGNIFVTSSDVVKVLDFGIAKILASSELPKPTELTIMGTAVGTLEYMAPEQLMGGRADRRTDIYTLGVVLYEVITGKRPYNTAGLDLLTDQLTSPPPVPSSRVEVPKVVDDILMRCLAEDADNRFQDVGELSRVLAEAIHAHSEPAAPAPRAATQPRPQTLTPQAIQTEPVRRISPSRVPYMLIAAAVLAGIVAIALLAR